MDRLLSRASIALLCCLDLAACGGGGGDAPPDDAGVTDGDTPSDLAPPDGSVADAFTPDLGPEPFGSVAEYHVAYTDMLCRAYFECPSRQTYQYMLWLGGFASVEECMDSERLETVLTGARPTDDIVAAGRVAFDGAAAAACLSAFYELLCDETAIEPADFVCDDVFTGLREEGETCLPGECVEGQTCDAGGPGGSCHGTCEPRTPPCGGCGADEYCDSGSDTCMDRLGEGTDCPFTAACVEGLICDEPAIGFGTCIDPASRAEDQPCGGSASCEEGLICAADDVCEPYFVVGAGMVCGGSLPVFQVCEPHLVCHVEPGDSAGTCQPPRGEGETCDPGLPECGDGLYCNSMTELCTAREPLDSSCATSEQCESAHCSPMNRCAVPEACAVP